MTPSSSVHGVAALLVAALAGCGSKGESPPPPPAPAVVDAAPPQVAPTGVTELPTYDPATGMHLDDKDREAPVAPARPRNRNARIIGIMLRSTPPGAIAAVDGQPIGPTPTYWEGEFTGGEREFTFALAKHAVARYRFTPTTSGVVHGRLEPIGDRPGAETPAIPMPAHPAAPVGATPAVTPPSSPVTTPDTGTGGELSGNPFAPSGSAAGSAGSAGSGEPAPAADGGAAAADAAPVLPPPPAAPAPSAAPPPAPTATTP